MTIAITTRQVHISMPSNEVKAVKEAPRRRTRNESSKKVTFLPFVTSYLHPADDYVVNDRWYSAQDYSHFRSQIQRDSEDFKVLNPQSERVLRQTMKACEKASASCGGVDESRGHEELSRLLKPKLESQLRKTMRDSPHFIGLHKYCVDYLARDKVARRYEMVEAVMTTQSAPWSSQGSGVVPEGVCESISRPSRLFAELIGQIAAKAA